MQVTMSPRIKPPEAPLGSTELAEVKIDAIAPSGNALHFDRLSAVSKVEPSAAADRPLLKPKLSSRTSAASLALPSLAP